MGPFLARRDIVTALGGPLYDDPGKVWFVAMEVEQVAGFGAIQFKGDEAHFCSDYVVEEYRRQGLHTRLVAERLEYAQSRAKLATATATVAGQFAYRANGFNTQETSKRPMKNFTRLERKL